MTQAATHSDRAATAFPMISARRGAGLSSRLSSVPRSRSPLTVSAALEGEAEHGHASLEQASKDLGRGGLRRDTSGYAQLHLAPVVASACCRTHRASGEDLQATGAELWGNLHKTVPRRRGTARNLGNRALRNDAAAVQDQHPVACLLHLGQQVGAQYDGDAVLTGDPRHELEHLKLADRIQTQRRLVEEDHLGVIDQCSGDSKTLPHAPAVAGDERSTPLGEAYLGEQAVRGHAGIATRAAEQLGVECQPFLPGLPLGIAGALGNHADSPADLHRAALRHAGHREPTSIGLEDGRQYSDHRRLPGAIGTEEAQNRTGLQLEVE
jgi:hypothetical protein